MSVMNKEELSKLILENQKEMYVLAYSILKNQADAQDAVSECIVRAFENRTSLRKRTSARSWLMKILINVSRSAITKRQKMCIRDRICVIQNLFQNLSPEFQPVPE